jgi:hypothetical protein
MDAIVEQGSQLIHSCEEISMDMEAVDRLILQIQSINRLLDQLESHYK